MDNILRAILLALDVCNFLFTLTILIVYIKRQSVAKTLHTNLTKHVVSILVGFQMLCIYIFTDILGRLGQEPTWRTWYLIATFLVCLVSEFFMFNYQMKRFRRGE